VQAGGRAAASGDAVEKLAAVPGRCRAGSAPHETGNAITQIVLPAQHGDHILVMSGLEEFETAEFDEWNVAAGQLDFERRAVARRSEQDRLGLEELSSLAIGKKFSTM